MPVRCSVSGCKTKGSSGLHSFPANLRVREEWILRTKVFHLNKHKIVRSWNKVCAKHFTENDYTVNFKGQKRLKPKVIPSLFLPDLVEHNYIGSDSDACQRQRNAPLEPNYDLNNNAQFGVIGALDDVVEVNVHTRDSGQAVVPTNCHKNCSKTKLIAKLNQTLRQKDARIKKLQAKLKAQKITLKRCLDFLQNKFNQQQFEFFKMQIKNSGRKPKGRRYSKEQKSLCLSLYKQSPKNYRYMRKFFVLPDKRTIGRHAAHLMFDTGINTNLFALIKAKVQGLPDIEKYCIVVWDEMAIKAHLQYNHGKDQIDGFVDMGFLRRPVFATHSLTFMVQGICNSFKQPVTYYYTTGLKSFELAELIRLVIGALLDTGLKVIGSVSDQEGANSKAVNYLVDPKSKPKDLDGKLLTYTVNNSQIVHCYDPPHLLKGIRNNLQTKDLEHVISDRWNVSTDLNDLGSNEFFEVKTATWDDISELYLFHLRASMPLFTKILDEHINPNKKKMKVDVAAQVLSETYGTVMLNCSNQNLLPRDFSGTAQALLFFNDLFDTLNGSGKPKKGSLKGNINGDSIHFDYWDYALYMLKEMNWIDKTTGKFSNRAKVLHKFQSTIKGYTEIIRICSSLGMQDISLRLLIQDGLENFNGCVRSCCQIAVAPIASHYRSAFCTLIMNNLISADSLNANCKKDSATALLTDIHDHIIGVKNRTDELSVPMNEDDEDVIFEPVSLDDDVNSIEAESMSSVSYMSLSALCATVCKKILQASECTECKITMQATCNARESINKRKIGEEAALVFPSKVFIKNFKTLWIYASSYIPYFCHEKSLKRIILFYVNKNVECCVLGCPDHNLDIVSELKELTVSYCLVDFCKEINKLLHGKTEVLPSNHSFMHANALEFRQKRKKIGKYSDIFVE